MATFQIHYGREETRLEKWHQLCNDCGVQPASSITKCKSALRAVAVNIWDLIKARETGNLPVRTFRSKAELRVDLYRPGRRFPLSRVKASEDNKLLRALLVTIQ
ncbi:hypothetical protein M409DRAFT_71373 [Zasmidium cellare ATCC 36951]|uniref:Uncharacterized protein n=1 Tax=Zasmidium cellare ATCC 36951 TaxID=1080233 RepID=A0A6A6BYF6_ZASCE|nr:uncharacterized protein M409DRAFT_71373 [Zasmidium cellare ATCC 36951]KAF2158960.1 hypothetical protein M409DRAFT_71373 [Zasmidium cellare ATCC 36951]